MSSVEDRRAPYRRCALYVDFDNIYSGLARLDADAAYAFATKPGIWASWLEDSAPMGTYGDGKDCRRFLLKRCYMNPIPYYHYRPFFTRSAFETVDCPPLTNQGKTSTDMNIAVDMIELINHHNYIDEFFILSADADFTPVLLKLRKHDRRTVILATGFSSPAYTAASDILIDQDVFLSVLLGNNQEETGVNRQAEPVGNNNSGSELDKVSKVIKDLVASSSVPVSLAKVAQNLRARYPELQSDWGGHNTLSNLLDKVDLTGLELDRGVPGYLYDSDRHSPPTSSPGQADNSFEREHPAIAAIAKRVSQLTYTPFLSPDQYKRIFTLIADEVNKNGYHFTSITKAVRDNYIALGASINRPQVNFVLSGIISTRHFFVQNEETAEVLAKKFLQNVLMQCNRSQLDLSELDEDNISIWIRGKGLLTKPEKNFKASGYNSLDTDDHTNTKTETGKFDETLTTNNTPESNKRKISLIANSYNIQPNQLLNFFKTAGMNVETIDDSVTSEQFAQIKPAMLKVKEFMK